jgi:alpha-beta hydrolase superfamily lysophospholipase
MENVSFRNSRGLRLTGVLHLTQKPTKKAVITAHGFTSDKDGSHGKFPRLAQELSGSGIATLRFDFSGCGESDTDTITVAKQVDDLRSAITFMRGKGYSRIALVGSSLGGLVSLLAYDKNIRTMALWAPVTKAKVPHLLDNQASQKEFQERGFATIKNKKGTYRVGKEFMTERTSLDRKKILSAVRCPVLILHGNKDNILPLQDSSEAIRLLPKGSRLEVIEGANHHFTGKVDEVVSVSAKWLEKLL